MQIYHGTISTGAENIIKNGIVLEKGKPKVDFGQGFEYMNAVGSHFHNKTHKYDIVNGFIADNDIVLLASTLKTLNKRVQKDDIDSMTYNYFTNQISFYTKESLAYIKLIRCDMIKRKGDVVNG